MGHEILDPIDGVYQKFECWIALPIGMEVDHLIARVLITSERVITGICNHGCGVLRFQTSGTLIPSCFFCGIEGRGLEHLGSGH